MDKFDTPENAKNCHEFIYQAFASWTRIIDNDIFNSYDRGKDRSIVGYQYWERLKSEICCALALHQIWNSPNLQNIYHQAVSHSHRELLMNKRDIFRDKVVEYGLDCRKQEDIKKLNKAQRRIDDKIEHRLDSAMTNVTSLNSPGMAGNINNVIAAIGSFIGIKKTMSEDLEFEDAYKSIRRDFLAAATSISNIFLPGNIATGLTLSWLAKDTYDIEMLNSERESIQQKKLEVLANGINDFDWTGLNFHKLAWAIADNFRLNLGDGRSNVDKNGWKQQQHQYLGDAKQRLGF